MISARNHFYQTFFIDSRWLAISTKRGTSHIFPINCYGGVVNARTHSKPYIVNRTTKHQRTAGFEEEAYGGSSVNPLINSNLNSTEIQQYQMQQMLHQNYDNSFASPVVFNNNPKLRSLMEPFIIPAYGQLKQPNTNSTFQSSVISTNATANSSSFGLLTVASSTGIGGGNMSAFQERSSPEKNKNESLTGNVNTNSNGGGVLVGLNGSNMVGAAFNSAAVVTENMTHLGIKNFSLLGLFVCNYNCVFMYREYL